MELVIWVSKCKDVLYSFFFLAACINYLKYLDFEKQRKYLIYSFLLFLASCLSKGQAAVLPIVFLLVDYWRERKFERNVFVEKLPFLVLSLLFGLIATNVQSGGNFMDFRIILVWRVTQRWILKRFPLPRISPLRATVL